MTYDVLAANGGIPQQHSRTIGGWFRLLVSDRRILFSWIVFVVVSCLFAYALMSQFDDSTTAPPLDKIVLTCAGVGYWAWSMYWGVPGCLVLLRRLWRYAFYGFSAIGMFVMAIYLTFALIALVYYPPLGGGVFHFLRRWWTSGRGKPLPQQPLNVAPAYPQGMMPAIASSPYVPAAMAPAAVVAPPALIAPPAPVAAPAAPVAVSAVGPSIPITTPVTPAAQTSDLEHRLRELGRLHERGVISRDEHDRRRLAILDTI